MQNTLEDDRIYYPFIQIEKQLINLKRNRKTIIQTDLGAGSIASTNGEKKTIRQIAKSAGSSKDKGAFLFRLANWSKAKNILEFGTSLGISAAYLGSALKDRPKPAQGVHSFEGCPNLGKEAQTLWKKLKLKNVGLHIGDFSETVPKFLDKSEPLDIVFFDGNHQNAPTLEYFEWCLKKSNEQSIFIFDDIHWNKEMADCWQTIQQDSRVNLAIDLYQIGLVFFLPVDRKQAFTLIPKRFKPWQLGLFAGKQH